MRIGILTLPLETNYGGILQAYALQKVLRDMGHDVMTIDRHNRRSYPSFSAHAVGYMGRLYQHFCKGKDVSVRWNPFISDADYQYISRYTRSFLDGNVNLTDTVFSDQLEAIDKKYQFDAYVVGSDQVWLPSYYPSSFLSFVKRDNAKKVFYAASCGRISFIDRKGAIETCKSFAEGFDGISVREDTLVPFAEKYLGRTATHVLDPTFLLSPSEYMKLVKGRGNEKDSVVFKYILDSTPEKDAIVNAVSNKTGHRIASTNAPQKYIKRKGIDIDKCVFPPVEEWLSNLNDASFVVTDSFHGTVFSILFNKQFVVIGNKNRGLGRFKSLLKMFGLEDRMIANVSELDKVFQSEIDYDRINRILEEKRAVSLSFLSDSLR